MVEIRLVSDLPQTYFQLIKSSNILWKSDSIYSLTRHYYRSTMASRVLRRHAARLCSCRHPLKFRGMIQPTASIAQLSKRAFASKEKGQEEGEKDFKGQLWQSTTNRVQREREEQEDYARQRYANQAAQGPGIGAALGLTTGKHRVIVCMVYTANTILSNSDGIRL